MEALERNKMSRISSGEIMDTGQKPWYLRNVYNAPAREQK